MNSREALLTVGVATAVVGIAVVYVPVATFVDVPSSVPLLISAVALVAALVRGRAWLTHESRDVRPAERERPSAMGVPGDEVDVTLARAPPVGSTGGRGGADNRRIQFRQSLRDLAVETLVTFQGYTTEEARRAVDRGTWTDDPHAAAFFTTPTGEARSVAGSVRGTFSGERPFHRRAEHAASEIEQLGRGADA